MVVSAVFDGKDWTPEPTPLGMLSLEVKRLILLAEAMVTVAACASYKAADEPGTPIGDSTVTAKDTTNPSDTGTHIRDSVPDSTSR